MLKLLILSPMLLSLTLCASVNDSAICEKTVPLADEARAALLGHAPDVPDDVGDPTTQLIIAVYAGCARLR